MIFYFSATGNCKMIANRIAEKTGEKTISIAEQMKAFDGDHVFDCDENEKIGFIVPTYFWGVPSIVKDFVKGLAIKNADNAYVYIICSYGTATGQCANMLAEFLGKRDINAKAAFSVKMVDTWVPTFNLKNKEKNNTITQNAVKQVDKIISQIEQKVEGKFVSGVLPTPLANCLYKNYSKFSKTKNFFVEDNCIGCGLCARQCPTQAIELQNKKPVWIKENCTLCLGCLHRCPVGAINYKKKNTHGQFTNPLVKL